MAVRKFMDSIGAAEMWSKIKDIVTSAIGALDGNLNSTTPGSGKTLTAFSQTDGKVSATFGNISITKSQVSDFPSSMPASDVSSWAKAASKPSYTASEVGAVPTSRTINSKALTGNITLNASDVGASTATNWGNGTATYGSVCLRYSEATGDYSVAEGQNNTASGENSHVEGYYSIASGEGSHAEGGGNEASGFYSHAGGMSTIANSRGQTAIGEYNIADTQNDDGYSRGTYAFIIGNGYWENNAAHRSNALAVDWNGNLQIAGTLKNMSGQPFKSSTTVSLGISDWNNDSQTVNVSGVTASNDVFVTPAAVSKDAYIAAGIWCDSQAAGTLTFSCMTVPESAITVNVTILN